MLLKKQLLSQQNLNNAFLSLTSTGTQSIQSSLTLSGGQLTLKNSWLSDNASSGYLRIDPQGNQVIIYDGVNNQQLGIYSSSGSEYTFITTINQASNQSYGLIDVGGSSISYLAINTNSGKNIMFGGAVGIGISTPNAKLHVYGNGDTRIRIDAGTGNASGVLELAAGNPTNGNMTNYIFTDASGLLRLYTVNGRALTLQDTNGGYVGIGLTNPSYRLHVYGDILVDNAGWFRVKGSSGFFFEDWAGGWQMTDGTWVRSYNGKGVMIEKNTPSVTSGFYDQGNLELKTNDTSYPSIGFHRAGYSAIALYHDGDQNNKPLRTISSDGTTNTLVVSRATTSTVLNDTTNIGSGFYTNSGSGLLNPDGTTFKTDWWHVINMHHYDNNGYGGQIAIPFYGDNTTSIPYWRSANGGTWGKWKPLGGGGGSNGKGFPIVGSAGVGGTTFTAGSWVNVISYNGAGRIEKLQFSYNYPNGGAGTHFDWNATVTIDGVAYSLFGSPQSVTSVNGYNYYNYLARHEYYGGSNQYDTYLDFSSPISFNTSLSVDVYYKYYSDGYTTFTVGVGYQYRTA